MEKYKGSWNLKEEIVVPDAIYTVVHIQQKHYSDIFTDRIYEELEKESQAFLIKKTQEKYLGQIQNINDVQKQIYKFLINVTTEKDFLYVEGRSFPHRYRDIFIKSYTAKTVSDINKNLNYKGSNTGDLKEPYYFIGASIYLQKERRMHVIGVENLALLNLTLSLYESKNLSNNDLVKLLNECHEAREGEMLKNMAQNFDDLPHLMNSLRFLVCGSKHDFKNNIEDWNVKNPHQKMNLIVFIPDRLF